jgi:hypothetical protein
MEVQIIQSSYFGKTGFKLPHYEKKLLKLWYLDIKFKFQQVTIETQEKS